MIQSHKKIRCSRELALRTAHEYHKKRRTLFYSSFECVFNFFFQNLLFSIVREQVLWYVFHYLIFQIVACLFVWLNKSFNVFFISLFLSFIFPDKSILSQTMNDHMSDPIDMQTWQNRMVYVCIELWCPLKNRYSPVCPKRFYDHNKTSHRLKCAQPVQLDDFKPLNVCHFEYCYFVKTRNQKRRVSRLVLAMDRLHTITNIDYHKQIV